MRMVTNPLCLASKAVMEDVQEAEVEAVDVAHERTGLVVVGPDATDAEEVAVCPRESGRRSVDETRSAW